jgi:antitoxin component of RelBE/YafQ-DinJ toxin-antitoxin module
MPEYIWVDESEFEPIVVTEVSKLQKATDYFKKLKLAAIKDAGDRNSIFTRNYKLYRKMSERVKSGDPETSTSREMHLTEVFIQVETILPRLIEALISFDPPFELIGNDEDDRRIVELNQALAHDRWVKLDPEEMLNRAGRDYLVYGSAIVKCPYQIEFGERVVREGEVDKKTGRPKIVVRKRIKTLSSRPIAEVVAPYDFYPIGKGDSIDDLDGMFHRSLTNYVSLKSKEYRKIKRGDREIQFGTYVEVDRIFSTLDAASTVLNRPQKDLHVDKGDHASIERDNMERNLKNTTATTYLQDLIKLDSWEYHGLIPKYLLTGSDPNDLKNSERFEMVEGIAELVSIKDENSKSAENDNSILIRLEENPYWSKQRIFVAVPLNPIDRTINGIGVPEMAADPSDALDMMLDAVMENTDILLHQPTIEDRNAGIDKNSVIKPRARIKADDISAIRGLFSNIPNFINDGYKMIAFLREQIERTVGAGPQLQGSGIPGTTTATEADQVFKESNLRLRSIIRMFEKRIVRDIVKKIVNYNYQFVTKKERIRIVGKKGIEVGEVSPDIVRNNFEIRVKGVFDMQSKQSRIAFLNNFFALALKAPQVFKIRELGKKIWEAFGFFDFNDVVFADQDIALELQKIEAEQDMLLSGNPVPVSGSDIVPLHWQKHNEWLNNVVIPNGLLTEENEFVITEHLENTQRQISSIQGAGNLTAQNGAQGEQPQGDTTNTAQGIEESPQGSLNEQPQIG